MSGENHGDEPETAAQVARRLNAVTEALESVVRDRSLLRALSLEERTRLLSAAGDVHNPDVVQRRRLNKVVRREKKASRVEVEETAQFAPGAVKIFCKSPALR